MELEEERNERIGEKLFVRDRESAKETTGNWKN